MTLRDITQRPRTKSKAVCLVYGCDRPRRAKGQCSLHYTRDYVRSGRKPVAQSLWATTISWNTAHNRARRLWGSASGHPCIECGKPAQEWAYDDTDPTAIYRSHTKSNGKVVWKLYSRFPEFYMPMCLSCHRRRDLGEAARIFHEYRIAKYGEPDS